MYDYLTILFTGMSLDNVIFPFESLNTVEQLYLNNVKALHETFWDQHFPRLKIVHLNNLKQTWNLGQMVVDCKMVAKFIRKNSLTLEEVSLIGNRFKYVKELATVTVHVKDIKIILSKFDAQVMTRYCKPQDSGPRLIFVPK